MAELADALVSGTSDRKVMQVQVLFPAPENHHQLIYPLMVVFNLWLSLADISPEV